MPSVLSQYQGYNKERIAQEDVGHQMAIESGRLALAQRSQQHQERMDLRKFALAETELALSKQLQQQGAQPELPPINVEASPEMADNQMGTANSLIAAGVQQLKTNPEAGAKLIKYGGEIKKSALAAQNEVLQQQKEVLGQVAGWVNQIDSQESLNSIYQQVEKNHPGIWRKQGLPLVYNDQTAPMFKQLGLAASSALQQAEIQLRQMGLQDTLDEKKARVEKAQADAVTAKSKAARERDGLPTPKEVRSSNEKYQEQLSREEQLYANSLAKRREAILKDTKKYPDAVKDYSLLDKLAADITDTTLEPKLTPREKALAEITQEEEKAHKNRLAAIQKKATALGIIVPKKKSLRQSAPEAAVAYLLEHDTPEMRSAFEAKYGYLPE